MKLQIGNFHVKDIVFGEKTAFSDGVLTVNQAEALSVIDPEEKLKNAALHIARPGEPVRIVAIKQCIEPRLHPDGRPSFPGYTGPLTQAGDGIVYALSGMSVMVAAKHSSMGDGIVDMSGPGARYSFLSEKINLVIYAERRVEKELELTFRVEEELRKAAFLLADYVAKTVSGMQPDAWECYDLSEKRKAAEERKLPRVALFMTVVSQLGIGMNEFIYGSDCHNMLPVFMHPNEILDSAVVSGQGPSGTCSITNAFQEHPVIKRLYQEHGETINFVGVVLVPGDVSDHMKRNNKGRTGVLAEALELSGAVVLEYGGGSNIDVDFFYLCAELEDRGIKTAAITQEHAGKMMTDPKADAIISTGDTGAVIELPPMEKVIGDPQSLVRDYYFGAWSEHDVYGPSLRPDGSLIVNTCVLGHGGNMTGQLAETVREY